MASGISRLVETPRSLNRRKEGMSLVSIERTASLWASTAFERLVPALVMWSATTENRS